MNLFMSYLSPFACLLLFTHFVDLNQINNSLEYSYAHHSGRNIRSLVPLDCQLGQWAAWTECSPCETKKILFDNPNGYNKRKCAMCIFDIVYESCILYCCNIAIFQSRFRNLQRPAMFGGSQCIGSLWEEVTCQTSKQCVSTNTCGDQFQCSLGRCIKRRLLCNGERDCEDASDEDVCESDGPNEIQTSCTGLFPIPGLQAIMNGYNILTNEIGSTVLDSGYDGYCEYVYNGDWRELRYDSECEHLYYNDDEKYFRKPYNIFLYRFEALADSGFSVEVYNDVHNLLTAMKKDVSFALGFSVQISVVKAAAGFADYLSFVRNLTTFVGKDVNFVRVRTKVQTAHFKMRRYNLILDEGMVQSLMKLPDEYNYGMYSKFIADYGTHYYTSGTMGGVFEFVIVLNKRKLQVSGVSAYDAGHCFAGSLGVLMSTASVSYEKCKKINDTKATSSDSKTFIEDVIPHVQGGDLESIAGMLGREIPDAKMYRRWGKSLKYVPAVIDFEVMPIYDLVSRSNLQSVNIKQQHLKRAMEEYLSEFHPCRCHACYNNGSPFLLSNKCICVCEPGFEGRTCQETKRKGITDGGWDCWSQWSPCSGGSRKRTRNCNHPPPKDGGAMCLGKNTQTQHC